MPRHWRCAASDKSVAYVGAQGGSVGRTACATPMPLPCLRLRPAAGTPVRATPTYQQAAQQRPAHKARAGTKRGGRAAQAGGSRGRGRHPRATVVR